MYMKNTTTFFLIALFCFLNKSFELKAQNPEKQKVKINYFHYPSHWLSPGNSSAKFVPNRNLSGIISDSTFSLNLKGFNQEDNQYRLILMVDDFKLNFTDVMAFGETEFKVFVTPSADAKLIIIKNDESLVKVLKIEPEERQLMKEIKSSDKAQVLKSIESIKKDPKEMQKSYLTTVIHTCQHMLNHRYSSYWEEETFRIFSIKPKKFDYTAFNESVDKFLSVVENIKDDKEGTIAVVNECIKQWEKDAAEYEDDNKARISPKNIDEIYLNLAQAYMITEDNENARNYWNLSLETKGNTNVEFYLEQWLPKQIESRDSIKVNFGKEERDMFPVVPLNKINAMNKSIFLDLILSMSFCEKHGNLTVLKDYFPNSTKYLRSYNSNNTYFDDTTEDIKQTYDSKGRLTQVIYTLTESMNTDGSWEYNMVYEDDLLTEVYLFDRKLYELGYESGKVTTVKYLRKNGDYMVYKISYPEYNKAIIRTVFNIGGKVQESKMESEVEFNSQGLLKSYDFVDMYTMKNISYTQYYTVNSFEFYNNNSDKWITVDYDQKYDWMGHVTERTIEENIDKNTITYKFY